MNSYMDVKAGQDLEDFDCSSKGRAESAQSQVHTRACLPAFSDFGCKGIAQDDGVALKPAWRTMSPRSDSCG